MIGDLAISLRVSSYARSLSVVDAFSDLSGPTAVFLAVQPFHGAIFHYLFFSVLHHFLNRRVYRATSDDP